MNLDNFIEYDLGIYPIATAGCKNIERGVKQ